MSARSFGERLASLEDRITRLSQLVQQKLSRAERDIGHLSELLLKVREDLDEVKQRQHQHHDEIRWLTETVDGMDRDIGQGLEGLRNHQQQNRQNRQIRFTGAARRIV
jgi:ParB-like chromosome segregation protein Spo0J